jgi:tetratricopeptide (TPR) repeat protein
MDGKHYDRRSNHHLRDALVETNWTEQQLAAAVNAVGAESGVALFYDRTAVAHWLAGTQPRPPVPELIAEAVSRRLGDRVTAADLDLTRRRPAEKNQAQAEPGSGAEPRPTEWNEDVAAELATLSGLQSAARRRSRRRPAAVPYRLEAPSRLDWVRVVVETRLPAPSRPPSPADHVVAAEAMARVFSADDDAFGGSHCRRALAAYLSAALAPALHTRARPGVRRRLLTAATQLTYLCAFMCFDDELHGLAQRYYRATLRLAAENGDATRYAVTLRAMSVQAYALDHHRHAVQLAESAAETAGRTSPARKAFLLGQLAVATAADHDRVRATYCLSAAERALDKSSSSGAGEEVIGRYHAAALAHQEAAVRALLGDTAGAVDALDTSIRHRPATERRSRAITLARLAELQLGLGHLEEAACTWHRFLDDYPDLASGRVTTALKTLRALLRPYARNPAARGVLHRATTITGG